MQTAEERLGGGRSVGGGRLWGGLGMVGKGGWGLGWRVGVGVGHGKMSV